MRRKSGFTLLEMLLVLVIVSSVIVLGLNYTTQKSTEMRRDRATIQYQQILNAGLAYNIATSKWPADIATLQTDGYLPNVPMINPWGNPYVVAAISVPNAGELFYAYSQMPSGTAANAAQAKILAGKLPLAFTTTSWPPAATPVACGAASSTCFVASAVPLPGQTLNNARSVNFANLYHHGACVPAPVCPGNMTPQIMAIPVSVSGVNDQFSTNVYPISSFTAYAYGKKTSTNTPSTAPGTVAQVADCDAPMKTSGCRGGLGWGGWSPSPQGLYWRVCMKIITEKGDVATTNPKNLISDWGQHVTILAITRCVPGSPPSEPTGSGFDVFTH